MKRIVPERKLDKIWREKEKIELDKENMLIRQISADNLQFF